MNVSQSKFDLRMIQRIRGCWLTLAGIVALSLMGFTSSGQTAKDPLTNDQVEQVRDTGAEPAARIKLYIKFIEGRTSEIHKMSADTRAQSPSAQIHNLMEEFTRLADELQDNLETYSEEHTDMRKTLRELVEHSAKWEASLHEPKPSQDYDFARKTALDTTESTTELAKKLLDAQEQYFASHKNQKKTAPAASEQ